MIEPTSFGAWLRKKRRALDLTQKAFADRVGCAEITVRRMEADEYKPSKELALILFEKLGIPESECLEWVHFARGLSPLPQKTVNEAIPFRSSTNLPVALTSFIGREREQDEVIHRLAKNRLVTIAGAGGIGKTRLALQVGQRLLNEYPNGIWYIPFDSLFDPALVIQTVASIFDIREGSSDRPLVERLTYSLSAKTALLIFDNCEHLLDACAQLIITLLTNCPNLKILATSREILNIEGEALHSTSTLSLPDQAETSLQKIITHESLQLFAERAVLVLSSFQLTMDNVQATANICQRLDGIPLAIELAAARVDILQVSEILEQLQHRFDLLVSGKRVGIPRHQTMRASLDWSWGLLNEAEQKFMRQLSIFAGGWTIESSRAICDGDTLDLTSALVKKSLIVVKQQARQETRYQFHEIVRQYAYEKLIESHDDQNIRTRHLKYFLGLSELAEPALRGPEQIEWMARLSDERDNIRTALAWANETDVEAGLYIASRLGRFWESFDIREENDWLSTFLQKPDSVAYPVARAKALYAHIGILNYSDQRDKWWSTIKECLELYRTLGDQYGEVDVSLFTVGEMSSAAQIKELLQRALELAQIQVDPWKQANMLLHIGWNYSGDESLALWKRAIPLFRQVGDWRSLADLLSHTGLFAMLNGDLELAQKSLDEASIVNSHLKDNLVRANILSAYAKIATISGEYGQAHIYVQEALEIMEELGIDLSRLFNRAELGYITLREGKIAEAQVILSETTQDFQQNKNVIGVVFSLEGMAEFYITVNKPTIAARLIGWADAARKKIHDIRPLIEQTDVDKIIATCLAKMGEVDFSDAYDEGEKMTLDEAVAYALAASYD